MEAGVVIEHKLAWFEDWDQTKLDIRFKECRSAGPLAHEGRDPVVVVERIKQTHPLSAMPGLLPPTRFALRTPAVRPGFSIIHARLIQIPPLLGGYPRQLGPKLLPQLFVLLSIAKGLFLCM